MGNELKVAIAAPPADEAANEALVAFFAKRLGVAKSNVLILRGGRSRHKQILIRRASAAAVGAKLGLGSAS